MTCSERRRRGIKTLLSSLIGLTAFAVGLGLIAFFIIRAVIQRAENRVIERYEALQRAQRVAPPGATNAAAPDPDLEGISAEDFEAGCKDALAQLAYRHRQMRRPARRHDAP